MPVTSEEMQSLKVEMTLANMLLMVEMTMASMLLMAFSVTFEAVVVVVVVVVL